MIIFELLHHIHLKRRQIKHSQPVCAISNSFNYIYKVFLGILEKIFLEKTVS